MTQQVDYKSSNIITADPKLIRRLRWGVFIGIITGVIPLLYGLAVCVYVLGSMLSIIHSARYLPEPPSIFWMTLIFLAPSAWLLTKAAMPRSILVFLEMLVARIGLALLIAGLWTEYHGVTDLLGGYANMFGIAWRRDQLILCIFIAWNVVIWAVLHLAGRNLRLVGLKKYAQAVTIWLALIVGWTTLVIAFYVANEYFSFYATALGHYVQYMAVGLLIILIGLLIMIESLAIMTSNALRRIQNNLK